MPTDDQNYCADPLGLGGRDGSVTMTGDGLPFLRFIPPGVPIVPLTKRELFTLVAMHGILAADPFELDKVEDFGRASVAFADASLAALDKPKE